MDSVSLLSKFLLLFFLKKANLYSRFHIIKISVHYLLFFLFNYMPFIACIRLLSKFIPLVIFLAYHQRNISRQYKLLPSANLFEVSFLRK